MIRNQWYAVLDSNEVKTGKPVGVTRLGEKLVFWRGTGGRVSCLRNECPHRGVALSTGKVIEDRLQCPFHGFEFDVSGQCTFIPANGKNAPFPKQMKTVSYPTYETGGFIFIWWGIPEGELQPPAFFDGLGSMVYASTRDPWKAHYSRVIENQLDVAHLPFVHYNTIGKGGRMVVDGPLLEWDGPNKFKLYALNRVDDGIPPRKAHEVARPDTPFWLEFIFPNLWQNHISEQVRIIVAFVPVDDENTLMYLHFYQGFVKLPVLRELIAQLSLPMNLYIAHQDRRVVETQLPKRSELRMGEKLIQADHPIVAYRARRQELIDGCK
jgi:phenylpropionate dioxygenase-like ring-hydroxylating dioxygenase large terminal subunit